MLIYVQHFNNINYVSFVWSHYCEWMSKSRQKKNKRWKKVEKTRQSNEKKTEKHKASESRKRTYKQSWWLKIAFISNNLSLLTSFSESFFLCFFPFFLPLGCSGLRQHEPFTNLIHFGNAHSRTIETLSNRYDPNRLFSSSFYCPFVCFCRFDSNHYIMWCGYESVSFVLLMFKWMECRKWKGTQSMLNSRIEQRITVIDVRLSFIYLKRSLPFWFVWRDGRNVKQNHVHKTMKYRVG